MSAVVPHSMHRKFKYAVDYQVDSSALTPAYFWDLTNMYDPDYTGVGGTTTGLSQWANLYYWYKVKGVKVVMRIENINTGDGTPALTELWWGWPGMGASPQRLDEQADSTTIVTGNGADNAKYFKKYFNVKRWLTQFGQVNNLWGTYDACGKLDGSVEPANKFMLGVIHDNLLQSGLVVDQVVNVRFKLTFYADIFARVPLSQD